MSRAVMHADMDAFFASVELKKRPELRGKPVVVGGGGDPDKRGVVSAASYEARKFGIHAGMPMRKAKELCKEAVFLPVDFEAYERESEKFLSILRSYTDLVESFGLDEAFLELRDEVDPYDASYRTALEIKARVKNTLGLTCSIGIGPNKLIAKMSSDAKKPDGLTMVKEEDVAAFLRVMPVRKLFGVGEKTEGRLRAMRVTTVGELAALPSQYLERNFGKSFGLMLHNYALGIDDSEVVPFHEPSSFSRELTFEEDTLDAALIRETVRELAKDAAERVRDGAYACRTVTLKIRFMDFKTITRSHTLENSTDSISDIVQAALDVLYAQRLNMRIRLLGVKVSNLEKRA